VVETKPPLPGNEGELLDGSLQLQLIYMKRAAALHLSLRWGADMDVSRHVVAPVPPTTVLGVL